MERKKWNRMFGFAVMALCIPLASCSWTNRLMRGATGYETKVACSSVFISHRDAEEVVKADLAATRRFPVRLRIDEEKGEVKASMFGMWSNRAVFRDCLGCTLTMDASETELEEQGRAASGPLAPLPDDASWPRGNAPALKPVPDGVDPATLEDALAFAFDEPEAKELIGTRAVVIVYRGTLIAEKYATGFTRDTPLLGWSMTKSVTNALVGILVRRGELDIHAPASVTEWSDPDDPRSEITLDQLLCMSSGLEWKEETYTTDVIAMLYREGDTAAFAASKPLAHAPGSRWCYSSGTSNIISGIIRRAVGGTDADYFSFPRRELFDKLGMRSAVLEPDASGTFIGSSYCYATALDWARFGLLYLRDGLWEGERILPEGWVAYSITPTPGAPRGGYGAHFWLNAGAPGNPEDRWMPGLPTDLYSMRGYDGQLVTIIPSLDLVVVRMGLTPDYMERWDHQEFLKGIIDALVISR